MPHKEPEKLRAYRREHSRKWRRANPERYAEIQRRWRKANPDKVKRWSYVKQLKASYGITPEQHLAMWEHQGGRCAICEVEITLRGRGTHIDHCHATGSVRGLLCQQCNKRLAAVEDTAFLEAATKYLETTGAP